MSSERAPVIIEGVMEDEEDKIQLETPTQIEEGAPLFENDGSLSGQESGTSSPEPNDEEGIFTLLFQQCDTEGAGEVEVEKLISYIRKVRLGQQHSDKEEVYDSQEDVPKMQYNLQLLKAMLDCNSSDDGKVDQPTYSHIIRMWVKDVRDRSNRSAASEQLEVSHLSDSPDNVEDVDPSRDEVSYGSYTAAGGGADESRESFETSGGLSTSHTEHDRIDLINSVADLKLDNKRLQERNKALQLQMEHSEENLKEIQSENRELKRQIKDFQANLDKLEQVEGDNTELAAVVEHRKRQCHQLTTNAEKLEQEVTNLREDLKSARSQLTILEHDKHHLTEESNAMKLLLLQKEELLSHQETTCAEVEAQLQQESQRVKELSQTLDEVRQARDELKSENSDLQTQIRLSRVRSKQPLSSTPYRPNAPSWHEELMEQESLTSKSSPILSRRDGTRGVVNGVGGIVEGEEAEDEEGVSVSASDSFTKILEETNLKINQKHNLLVRELSDLINQPTPSSSSRHSVERSVIQEKLNDRSLHSFESKLADLLRKKKKVEKENSQLATQVEELKKRLSELEQLRQVNGDSASHQHGTVEEVDNSDAARRIPVEEVASQEYREPDASTSFLLSPTSLQAPSTQLRHRPQLSRSAVVGKVDFDGTTSGNTPPLSVSTSVPSVEKSQQTDPSVVNSNIEELAFKEAYTSALKESSNKEFDELKERQDELSSQCRQLEKRAEQLRNQRGGWLSFLGNSAYRILKSLTLILFVVFFVLFIIVLLVALLDLLGTCGSHCPKSPAYVLYSNLGSYLQYTRTNSPI